MRTFPLHPSKRAAGRRRDARRHAGAGRANPSGAYLALAALLEWFPETAALGASVRGALDRVLAAGPLTYDLAPRGGPVATTRELAARVNAWSRRASALATRRPRVVMR